MITLEKLRVYDKYFGDEDQFARVGSNREKKLFEGNSDWFEIMNFKQDILLTSQNLASKEYKNSTFERMKILCDEQAIKFLMKTI